LLPVAIGASGMCFPMMRSVGIDVRRKKTAVARLGEPATASVRASSRGKIAARRFSLTKRYTVAPRQEGSESTHPVRRACRGRIVPHARLGVGQDRHHCEETGNGVQDARTCKRPAWRTGVVGPAFENPRRILALMMGRFAIEPVRRLAGGVARVVECDLDDLIETDEVSCRRPSRHPLRERRPEHLLKSGQGPT